MFRRGVLQGMGTHTLRDGTTRTGLFRDGEIIRRGFEKCPDGEEYEGDFHADHRHGLGRSVNNAKGAFWEYDGSWRFGAKQAIGYEKTDQNTVHHRCVASCFTSPIYGWDMDALYVLFQTTPGLRQV